MMKLKYRNVIMFTFLVLFGLNGISGAMADEPPSPYQLSQQEADEMYAAGEFGIAYKKYLSLARKGDTFSQYRLSYMNFQGQGMDVDWAEAFAWAALAAQGNNPDLIKYLGALSQQIPEEHHKRAAIKAENYLDKWGNLAIAENARRGAINELRQCTGSRLGTRCEEVYAMQMPKFWDNGSQHQPFLGKGSFTKGSISSSTGNGIGGPVLNTRYYQGLRFGVQDIEHYIIENEGVVTIGELETIDDEPVEENRN
jgi:TPR repeat protein